MCALLLGEMLHRPVEKYIQLFSPPSRGHYGSNTHNDLFSLLTMTYFSPRNGGDGGVKKDENIFNDIFVCVVDQSSCLKKYIQSIAFLCVLYVHCQQISSRKFVPSSI